MTPKSKSIIEGYLTEQYNQLKGTQLFLSHQLSIKPEWRIEDLGTDDQIEDDLKELKIRLIQLENAINELQGIQTLEL